MRSYPLWACLAALALAGAARAEDTYTIKLKHWPDAGKSITVTDTSTQTSISNILDADGKPLGPKDDKHVQKQEEKYTETVLEKGEKRPAKYKRVYEKAATSMDGKATSRSYEGRTIVFELKDGKYTVTAEGEKRLDAKDVEDLTRRANEDEGEKDQLLLPSKPVKVGDTWKIDGKALAKAFANQAQGELDVDKSGGDGKLTKVYTKDGKQFGVVEMTLKLATKVTKLPPGITKFLEDPTIDMKLTLDTALDGSSTAGSLTMTGKVKTKVAGEQKGIKFTVDSLVDVGGKQERTVEK
jgi:hypothetical protein